MSEEDQSKSEKSEGGLLDRVKGTFSGGNDEKSGESGGSGGESSSKEGESRIEQVRSALRSLGAGETDGFIEALDDDVAWNAPSGERFPGGGNLKGREEVREKHIGVIPDRFEEFGFEPRVFLEGEDRDDDFVVVLGAYRGKADSGEIDAPAVQVWQFTGSGQAKKVDVYADSADFPQASAGGGGDDASAEEKSSSSSSSDESSSSSSSEEPSSSSSSDESSSSSSSDESSSSSSSDESSSSSSSSDEPSWTRPRSSTGDEEEHT